MKIALTTITVLTGIVILSFGCSSNVDYIKEHAPAKWKSQGFEVVDYEGFQWGFGIVGTSYGGAAVWHRLKKIPDNDITYSGYLKRWGNEIHVYGPTAVDAIRP